MKKLIYINISYILIGALLSSCNNNQNNYDIDLSNFKIPEKKQVNTDQKTQVDSFSNKKENIINNLVPYKTKIELIGSSKLGKNDPFSVESQLDDFSINFKLKGFLNTSTNQFALVSFYEKEGFLSQNSIGGINTNLLPPGIKVKNIDAKNEKLIISSKDENYIFKLTNLNE